MKVLGLDTSGYYNAIGVADGNRVLADFAFEAKADSLEKIVAHIDATLQKAGVRLEDIDGFGVGVGPGSWTGIRVGVTVGKMLAFSTGKPVCGVSALEAHAYQVRNSASLICPIIYAGTRGVVYAAFYRKKNDTVIREGDYFVGGLADLAKLIKEQVVIAGTEAEKYAGMLQEMFTLLGDGIKSEITSPNGACVALLAARRLSHGESDDVLSLAPLYLKESTARAFSNAYSGGKG